jgi:hypothetical protein
MPAPSYPHPGGTQLHAAAEVAPLFWPLVVDPFGEQRLQFSIGCVLRSFQKPLRQGNAPLPT